MKKSPISPETHKTYALFSLADVDTLLIFIDDLIHRAEAGTQTPYSANAFIRHARMNKFDLGLRRTQFDATSKLVKVPAAMIFWLFRSYTCMEINCPVVLPHVCKLESEGNEQFYVASKEDWIAHRDATCGYVNPIRLSDHAKLQYITRVLGINVDAMVSGFPVGALSADGHSLGGSRRIVSVGDFNYLMDGNTCVTVLHKDMEAS